MPFLSLILGTLSVISSLICLWNTWYITVLFSIVGIATGIFSRKKFSFPSVSKAGIILSGVGIFLTIVFLIVFNVLSGMFLEFNA